jgi:hypothetical protein
MAKIASDKAHSISGGKSDSGKKYDGLLPKLNEVKQQVQQNKLDVQISDEKKYGDEVYDITNLMTLLRQFKESTSPANVVLTADKFVHAITYHSFHLLNFVKNASDLINTMLEIFKESFPNAEESILPN